MRRIELVLFLCVLALGVFVRAWHLQYPACWVDESESCINALTIREHGVPIDRYQSLPIYENCLVEATPSDPEYEFRDSSYSTKGFAVYHGWLPLYSIAASFACFGVDPDPVDGAPHVRHSFDEMQMRTIAARVPSVVFGAVFLIALFFAGRSMYGSEMGWSALMLGAFVAPCVRFAREARYYSATLALSALAVWAIVAFVSRGRWRDSLFVGVSFALLFHTHVLSFTVACVVLAVCLPFAVRPPGWFLRWCVAGGIVALATLPWILWTGFLEQAGKPPKAWPLLVLPHDLFVYPIEKLPYLLPLELGVLAMLVARSAKKLPARFTVPWNAHGVAGFVLALWLVVGFAAFIALTPAASFFIERITIALAGPGILLAGLVFAATTRWLLGERRRHWAPVCTLVFAPLCGSGSLYWLRYTTPPSNAQVAIEHLRSHGDFERGTRFFATPNEHLNLTFYSGLPVQSIAPLRKSFLDRADSPLVFVDSVVAFEPLTVGEVERVAKEAGLALDDSTARTFRDRIWDRPAREKVIAYGAQLERPLEELSNFEASLVRRQREIAPWETVRRRDPLDDNPAIFRGFELHDWSDWWPIFFLRFVDPLSRMGMKANYAERLRGARATVLPTTWTVYECPKRVER